MGALVSRGNVVKIRALQSGSYKIDIITIWALQLLKKCNLTVINAYLKMLSSIYITVILTCNKSITLHPPIYKE